jgi:transcription initiation factor TFIID TATA-box-binding protein
MTNKDIIEKNNGFKVENIVLNGSYTMTPDKIRAKELESTIKGSYTRPNFPALIWKYNGGTMLLFDSGKFVVTGLKTIIDAKPLIEKMRSELSSNDIKVIEHEYRVVNIVSTGNFDLRVDLNSFILEMENTNYEPEVFPGVVYRLKEGNSIKPKATFLIFSNGKFVCIGVKDETVINEVVKEVRELIGKKELFMMA